MSMDPSVLLLAAASLPVAAVALLIDRLFGYPDGFQDWFGHPVEWFGALIARLDRALNTGRHRKARGCLALLIVMGLTLAVTVPLTLWLRGVGLGWAGEALLASALLSQKSLEDHVRAVAEGLKKSLKAGRDAVRHIVGRDPARLDRSGVAKGALESLAENLSDGVTAPLFWLLVAGLPGVAVYKAVNTADSMIGHKSDAYREFGWSAARLDDLLNLVPARATGWLIALSAAFFSGMSGGRAVRTMAGDARKHVSPNAGWPEAAMAGALGVRLGGPRSYAGRTTDLPWMGDGHEKLSEANIRSGLRLVNLALNILTALVIAAFILTWMA